MWHMYLVEGVAPAQGLDDVRQRVVFARLATSRIRGGGSHDHGADGEGEVEDGDGALHCFEFGPHGAAAAVPHLVEMREGARCEKEGGDGGSAVRERSGLDAHLVEMREGESGGGERRDDVR